MWGAKYKRAENGIPKRPKTTEYTSMIGSKLAPFWVKNWISRTGRSIKHTLHVVSNTVPSWDCSPFDVNTSHQQPAQFWWITTEALEPPTPQKTWVTCMKTWECVCKLKCRKKNNEITVTNRYTHKINCDSLWESYSYRLEGGETIAKGARYCIAVEG